MATATRKTTTGAEKFDAEVAAVKAAPRTAPKPTTATKSPARKPTPRAASKEGQTNKPPAPKAAPELVTVTLSHGKYVIPKRTLPATVSKTTIDFIAWFQASYGVDISKYDPAVLSVLATKKQQYQSDVASGNPNARGAK